MIPVMTMEDIHDATETFARYGVPADRIFSEIMRARYLDYVLFLNPSNQQYGISIEDLYDNMKQTAEKLGMYEGDADTYVRVYTLALRVDPMVFAPGVSPMTDEMKALVEYGIERAEKSGKTVLFSGVESYLPYAGRLWDKLADKRLAFVVKSSLWKKRLQLLFPRCRFLLPEDLAHDEVKYDYIFHGTGEGQGEEGQLLSLLAEKGSMDWILPYDYFTASGDIPDGIRNDVRRDGRLSGYFDLSMGEREYAFLRFDYGKEGVSIGNMGFAEGKCAFFEQLKMPLSAFQEADEWNYDVYAYNASPALQAILAGNILQMEHALGQEFDEVKKETLPAGRYQILEAEALTDSEILKNEERPVVWDEPREGILLREGDLALSFHKGEFHFIPVGKGEEYVAGKGVFGLRMKGWYTPWFLKLYLDGPVGRLFLETMRSGETYAFSLSRLLRVPLPVSDRQKMEDITETAAKAVSRLAEAEQNWRRVKRESVGMMMGHSTM
ncbi:hypothetical protein [uncultured Dialister sp.]|uniref:hypothetical protein n=1 Tax=Dialister succinatiphilus TaxID=487173 RepID=UPI00267062D0|nr:hypothetical protein [uncultured Dialister sp.]